LPILKMSPLVGRVHTALTRREGGAPGMTGLGAVRRRESAPPRIWVVLGRTAVAAPGTIGRLSASWTLAVRPGHAVGRGGGWWRGAERLGEGRDRGVQLPPARALLLLRALPIAGRRAAGGEHGGWRGRRLRREERVLIEDDEAAIEELADFDAPPRVGAAPRPGRDLQPARAEPHGVVGGEPSR